MSSQQSGQFAKRRGHEAEEEETPFSINYFVVGSILWVLCSISSYEVLEMVFFGSFVLFLFLPRWAGGRWLVDPRREAENRFAAAAAYLCLTSFIRGSLVKLLLLLLMMIVVVIRTNQAKPASQS